MQVDLLVSMLDKESSPFIKARVLKCLSFLIVQGASFPVSSKLLDSLLLVIEDSNFQAEALQILQKVNHLNAIYSILFYSS